MRLSHAAGLYGVRGWVQIVDASTKLLASIWCSQPRLMTVVPYSPSPFSHCRFTPTHGAKLMQPAVEFDRSLLWLLTPKQYGQACLPMQSPPAYEACAPASWQAMIQVVGLSGWPTDDGHHARGVHSHDAPVISNRLISRCPIFEVLPRICRPPVDFCLGTSPRPGLQTHAH